jgi:hypothetical protein
MPTRTIPDLNLQYSLILFDAQGRERTDDPEGGVHSNTILQKVQAEKPTHIFLFSHGWKGDVPSAIDQYNRWIGAMWRLTKDRDAMGAGFRPLFIGLHWPSRPWGEETVGGASFGTGGLSIPQLIDDAVEHFGGGEGLRKPLETIFHAYAENPAEKTLSPEVLDAYKALGKAIGFSAGGGAGSAPDEEGAELDPQKAVTVERRVQSFGIGSSIKNGILAGLRQASFWTMKHRARTVGEQGMHKFVAQLQQSCDAQIHLMGHSFGCIVVSSILGGPNGKDPLPKPVESAALVQGALSLWSYADSIPSIGSPGYFRRVPGAVSGPIITTQSMNDTAVGLAYPAAVGLVGEVTFGVGAPPPLFGGVGTWGVQGTARAKGEPMLPEDQTYGFERGRIYNLEGSRFIAGHSAIDGPQVAHALWQAALAGRRP